MIETFLLGLQFAFQVIALLLGMVVAIALVALAICILVAIFWAVAYLVMFVVYSWCELLDWWEVRRYNKKLGPREAT